MITIIVLLLLLTIFYMKNKKTYGYLDSHITGIKRNNNYEYKITNKNGNIEGIVYDNKKSIGRLFCTKWETKNNYNLYIGDDLFILPKYRNNGIANNLVNLCSNTILEKNGFGIFSTNKELSLENKLFELYWVKYKTNYKTDSNIFKEVSWNNINFDNYPNHQLLKAEKSYIQNFLYLQSLKKNKFIYVEKYNTIICVESLIDNDEDSVSHVKWFWSNNMSVESIKGVSKYLGDDYVSIPKISVNMTEKIWDKSYCYLHCKPKNIKIQKLDEKDILGWFLC